MQKGPITPKGFRDIDPELAKKRRETINSIAAILEESDFVPLETPIIEFAETLLGKYGEEEKLVYQFQDRGGRNLALRYDLTIPLARYVANNLNLTVNKTFKRYQIGEVFRGENTQKGRWRQFTQFDFDTVGLSKETDSAIWEDAKIIATTIKAVRKLGLKNAKMLINDRRQFSGVPIEAIRIFDKLDKVGLDGVIEQLRQKSFSDQQIEGYKFLITTGKKEAELSQLFNILESEFSLKENSDFEFSPSLARGLDYYTSTVMELKPNGIATEQSIGGGGRYDDLIGMFAGRKIPAVGFSFGLDRLMEIL
ncbi:ATP phosphoribosyltransferase regulatory subunit [Candidatus Microgenomates bacterium]|nr:ATP phosphoribosyltransferase regulatory subunit [Candidatus Microgenomates bacterium]